MKSTGLALYFLLAVLVAEPATAAHPPAKLGDKLSTIRGRVIALEKDLIDSAKTQKEAQSNIRKIKTLMKLQQEERDLGKKRLEQLEATIGELESRRGLLRERVQVHQESIRRSLIDIARSIRQQPTTPNLPESEKIEAPRRKVLSNLVDRELREIEVLKADLADADQLESRIQEEKQHLAYLFQDLKEQESVMELNRQLQVDLLRKKYADRVSQLDNYRKLKSAEVQVETLIRDFNARMELERTAESEKTASQMERQTQKLMQGAFAKLKGTLSLPIDGKIVSSFGRSFDSESNLYIFKKGVDIATGAAGKKLPVKAVSSGKVAFSGELPNYGRLTIIDHGDHFYSLCAHLGELTAKEGDKISAGDPIGWTDEIGTPIYFEIRARNVAVNPLQWVSN
jgi:murein hydrolase activator